MRVSLSTSAMVPSSTSRLRASRPLHQRFHDLHRSVPSPIAQATTPRRSKLATSSFERPSTSPSTSEVCWPAGVAPSSPPVSRRDARGSPAAEAAARGVIDGRRGSLAARVQILQVDRHAALVRVEDEEEHRVEPRDFRPVPARLLRPGGSILMTSAPSQPRNWVHVVPASNCVRPRIYASRSARAQSWWSAPARA